MPVLGLGLSLSLGSIQAKVGCLQNRVLQLLHTDLSCYSVSCRFLAQLTSQWVPSRSRTQTQQSLINREICFIPLEWFGATAR